MKKLFTLLSLCTLGMAANAQTRITEKWTIPNTTRFYWGMTYQPAGYNTSDTSYPLIIFTHGYGEGYGSTGADSVSVDSSLYNTGLPKYLKNGNNIPFLVFAPQTRIGDISGAELNRLINLFKAKYKVDRNRVYLTGLSFGGRSVMRYFLENTGYGDSITAAASLATHYEQGDSAWRANSDRWAGKDIWLVCGTADNNSPSFRYNNSIRYADSINANGGTALLTPVPGGGHNGGVWDNVYNKSIKYNGTTDIYAWFLQHSLQPPPPDTTPVSVSQRILIDLGAAATTTTDTNNVTWNNITSGVAGTWLATAKDTAGTTVNLSISSDKKPSGTYTTGDISVNTNGYINPVGNYPASAIRDNVYFHTSSGITSLTFNIPAGKKATITFWGNREGTGPRILQLRKAGDTAWKEYDAAYNHTYTNNAQFTNCYGTQVIEARVKTGSTFGHISVIDIRLSDSATSLNQAPTTVITALAQEENTAAFNNSISLRNNPAKGNAVLTMNTAEKGKMTVQLFNNRGQLSRTYNVEKPAGYFQQPINLAGIPAGLYYLQIRIGHTNTTKKLVVLP